MILNERLKRAFLKLLLDNEAKEAGNTLAGASKLGIPTPSTAPAQEVMRTFERRSAVNPMIPDGANPLQEPVPGLSDSNQDFKKEQKLRQKVSKAYQPLRFASNPNCFLSDSPISLIHNDVLLNATVREYEGRKVVIYLNGRETYLTEYHPVLTSNGWKPACQVTTNDYLLVPFKDKSIRAEDMYFKFIRGEKVNSNPFSIVSYFKSFFTNPSLLKSLNKDISKIDVIDKETISYFANMAESYDLTSLKSSFKLVKPIAVSIYPYTGKVYDFQTKSSLLISLGVVHNCCPICTEREGQEIPAGADITTASHKNCICQLLSEEEYERRKKIMGSHFGTPSTAPASQRNGQNLNQLATDPYNPLSPRYDPTSEEWHETVAQLPDNYPINYPKTKKGLSSMLGTQVGYVDYSPSTIATQNITDKPSAILARGKVGIKK